MDNNEYNSDTLTADIFSDTVIKHAEEGSTYLEALVDVCDLYDIPYESVTNFLVERKKEVRNFSGDITYVPYKERINLITPLLKDRLDTEHNHSGEGNSILG